jgi:hypothetical protein
LSNVRLENIRHPIVIFKLLDLGARTNIRTQTLASRVARPVRRRRDNGRKPAAANKAAMGGAVSSIHSFLLDDSYCFVAVSQQMLGSSVLRRALHAPLSKHFRQIACPLYSQGKTLTGYDCVDVENDLMYVYLVCCMDRDVFLGNVGAVLPMVRRVTMAVRVAVTFPGSMLSDAKKDSVSLVCILI